MSLKRPTFELYDDCVYDYDTTNISFVAMAGVLRKKGVENHSFFMKLYDEDLRGIDPYDDNLTLALKYKIIQECHRNFYYFIREVMRLPAPGGAIRFNLHRGNLAAVWSFMSGINTYLIMPRQFGKTWIALAYSLWLFNFGSNYTKMLYMNKSLRDSQENLKRLKEARDLLPDFLRLKVNEKGKEFTDNVNEIKNGLHNEIITKASARNSQAADNLGRGLTIPWLWFDELGFLPFNDIIWAAAIPAWKKASEVAKQNGVPTSIIITTTPGDRSTAHGEFAYDIKEMCGRFSEDLYDKDPEEVTTWLEKNSRNGFLYIEYSYQQLGLKDADKYFAEMQQLLLFNWSKIRREILLQWCNSTSNSPFDAEDLRHLREVMIESDDKETIVINKYYKMNIYRPLDSREKYLICVDPAKGKGDKADSTAIVVVNAKTLEPHAIFKSNVIQYKETYRFIYTLVMKHIPNSVIIVENNIDTVIEYLKNSPLKHMVYYEFKANAATDKRKDGVAQPKDRNTLTYGLNTNTNSRRKYFDLLFADVHDNPERLNAQELTEEIEALEYKTSDRIEATSGKHDDCIMAYLFASYIMAYGNNKARFGLFFSDSVDTSSSDYVNRDAFSTATRDFYDTKKNNPLHDNPFFNGLMYTPETLDDIERKLGKSLRRLHLDDDDSTPVDDIFGGNVNDFGMNMISEDAFSLLNEGYKNRQDEETDIYGNDFKSGFVDLNDNSRDNWW